MRATRSVTVGRTADIKPGELAGFDVEGDLATARARRLADLHAALGEEAHSRLNTHPNDREITVNAPTAVGDHPFDAAVAFKFRHDIVVRVLSELLAIPNEHIATIGDMPNDVLMFERSGTSIAMANARPDVRRAATFVTSSNTEEGFAEAMERFILRVPPT